MCVCGMCVFVCVCLCVCVCVCLDSTGDVAKQLTDGSIWGESRRRGKSQTDRDEMEVESSCSGRYLNILLSLLCCLNLASSCLHIIVLPMKEPWYDL